MSQYESFDITTDEDDGTTTPISGQVVQVYDVTNGVPLDDVQADAFGVVPGGTLDVEPGTLIRFAVIREDGKNRFTAQVTF